MTTPRPRALKALPYALVFAVAAYLYFVASHFEFHRRAGTLGPDFWPKAILVLLMLTCAYEVARVLLTKKDVSVLLDPVEEEEPGGADAHLFPECHPVLLVLGIVATLTYVALVTRLGFFVSTSVYLAVFLAIGGYRRWRVLALVSVGGALVLMFVFMKVVYVSLPIGEAPFSAVTLALMQLMGIR